MEKLKDKFLNVINGGEKYGWKNETAIKQQKAATSCAEITQDTAIEFAEWIGVNHWNYLTDMGKSWWSKKHGTSLEMKLTTEELFNLFIETI